MWSLSDTIKFKYWGKSIVEILVLILILPYQVQVRYLFRIVRRQWLTIFRLILNVNLIQLISSWQHTFRFYWILFLNNIYFFNILPVIGIVFNHLDRLRHSFISSLCHYSFNLRLKIFFIPLVYLLWQLWGLFLWFISLLQSNNWRWINQCVIALHFVTFKIWFSWSFDHFTNTWLFTD